MRLSLISLIALIVFSACNQAPPTPTVEHSKVYSKEAQFEPVRDDLKTAIENRGLVIDHTSHIHNMLTRTGKDLETITPVYVDAESYIFCSAVVSRNTMEADPHNIVFCPYVVTVYTTVQEPNKVHVAYRRPQPVGSPSSRDSLVAVDRLLDGIAREALNLPVAPVTAKPVL